MPEPAQLMSAADWIAGLICIADWLGNRLLTSSLLTAIETKLFERVVGFAVAALLTRVLGYWKRKETNHDG